MIKDNIFDYGILNGEIVSKDIIEEKLMIDTVKVYDVLRIERGIPIYLEEHLSRLNKSIELAEFRGNITKESFKKNIEKLIQKSNNYNNNIKTTYFEEGKEIVEILYMSKSKYPKEKDYNEGYKTILIYDEREEPNAKILNIEKRKLINKILESEGADEGILISENKILLEGSRSNIFFVKGEKIITSPDDKVLLGTIRQKVLELCAKNNITVIKRELMLEELTFFEGAFITATSLEIMPLNRIDSIKFNVKNKMINKLRILFNKEKEEYMRRYKT